MAISNKIERKIEQSEVQAVQTQSTAAAESTRQTQAQKPVNMVSDKKVDEETLKNNEIINYMNSDKFKKLSEEEQLKYFKEHYCTGLTDEQTSAMFTNAKKLAAEAAQISSVSDGAKTNNAAAKETALTADARKQAEQAVVKELQTVQKTENPSRKDVYEYLLKKETDGTEMTDAEQAVLKTYKSLAEIGHPDFNNAQSASAGAAPSAAAQQTSNELVPMSRVLSSKFLEKSPQEKLNIYMDAFLTKNDPDYGNLSDKEKQQKCSQEVSNLIKKITGGKLEKLGKTSEDRIATYGAMALLTDLNVNGKKLSDIPSNRIKLQQQMKNAFNSQLKTGINALLNSKELQNKTAKEQLLAIGEFVFAGETDYQSLKNTKEKESYVEKKIDTILKEMNIPMALSDMSEASQEITITIFKTALKDFANSDKDYSSYIKDIKKDTISYTAKLQKDLIKSTNPDDKKASAALEEGVALNVYFAYKGIKKPTLEDKLNYYLQKLKGEGKLTPAEQYNFEMIQKRAEFGTAKHTDANLHDELILKQKEFKNNTEFIRSTYYQDKLEQAYEKWKKNKNDPAAINELYTILDAGAENGSIADINEIRAWIDGKNLRDPIFKKFSTSAYARVVVTHEDVATVSQYADILDDKAYDTAGKIFYENYDSVEDATIFNTVAAQGKHCNAAAETLNKYRPKEFVDNVEKAMVKSGKLTYNQMSGWTQSLVTTASPERQKYYVTEFGKLKNAAVTNGLAAACNSVDNSVKAYYKQALVKAIESGNYTAEQKAGFAKAMKTGTVSSSAEPRTADKAQVSDKAPASAKADTASAAQTAQTSELQAKVNAAQADLAKETAASAIRDTASSYGLTGSTQASKTSSASSTASAASLSSASSAQSAKEASEAQKEKAMANAASTKEDIDKSVKKWEEEHNTTLTENEIKSLQTAVCAKVVEELLNDPETANSTAEVIHKLVANSTSVTDLYTKLVDIYGTKVKDKFIEILAAKGSSSQVSSFAQNATNSEDIKNLYLKCDNAVLKTELLNMLPPTSVSEMLRKGQIEDLTTIDYKILSAYITDNIGTMSNTEFNKYLQYLPLDERQKLCQLRLKSNPSSAEDSTISGDFAQTVKSDKATAITAQNSASHEEGDAASPFRSGPAQTETDESARLASNGYAYGSDNWLSSIQAKQSGIKVPPSDSYDTEAISFEEDFWDIGSSGSTKVSFNERYDKQKHTGAVYWG